MTNCFHRIIASRFRLYIGDCFVSPMELLDMFEQNWAVIRSKQGANAEYEVRLKLGKGSGFGVKTLKMVEY